VRTHFAFRILQILFLFTVSSALAENRLCVVVSVPEQRLYVFNPDGDEVTHYPVSTSKYGVGDSCGSYNTPLGKLEVAAKYGDGAVTGTVFKSCVRTGEICPVNARGRDPIVTRIMWLRGTETQNSSAFGRRIYIHGTPDEAHIGRPASFGCIRMRSKDIIALFATMEVGATVEITNSRVGGMFSKAKHAPLPMIASTPTKPAKITTSGAVVASATSAGAKAKPSMGTPTTEPKSTAVAAATELKPKAALAVTDGSSTRSKALSLSEPLIGTPDSPDAKPASKRKSAVTASGRKSRS